MKRVLVGLLLAGCTPTAPDDDDVANDDDSALVDDDDAGDECPAVDPLDIEAEAEVELAAVAPTAVGETLQEVIGALLAAGPDCPLRTGELPTDAPGSVTFSGPCAGEEFTVAGSLRVDVDPTEEVPTTVLAGDGFEARGPLFRDGEPGVFALWGSADVASDGTRDGYLRVGVDGFVQLIPDRAEHPLTAVFPLGFDGRLDLTRRGEDGTRTFEGTAEGIAVCRSRFGWEVDLAASPDCGPEPTEGSIAVRFDGREAVITAGDGTCDGCLEWTVDGVPREEPLCFDGG